MNLVDVVGERIKKNVLGLGANEKEWRILIIDQDTANLLHHSIPMSEVLSHNIAMIERLEEERSPSKDFTAIYFVKMNSAKAKRIQKDVTNKMYPSAWVVSMCSLEKKDEEVMESLVKKAEKHRKKNGALQFIYKTVIFDFISISADVFQLCSEGSFYTSKETYLNSVSEKIRGLSRTIHTMFTPIPVGKHAQELATRLDTTGPGKIIIVERGVDLNTPLMHFFTFESMLWDLGLGGPGYVIEVQKETKKPAQEEIKEGAEQKEKNTALKEETPQEDEEKKIEMNREHTVWESIKNTQLIKAHEILTELVKETTKSVEKEKKGNIKRLVRAVQELPAQTRTLKEIKILMGLLEECVEYFNRNGIREVAELEQGMVTGKTSDGKTYKKVAAKELMGVLESCRLTQEEKHRLYVLFVYNYGSLERNEQKHLIERGHLRKEFLEEAEEAKKHLFGRKILALSKRSEAISRYVPSVCDIVNGVLTKDERICAHFEIPVVASNDVLTGASLRKREFVFKAPAGAETSERKPVIVYFIGGVCISEITEIREISKNTGQCILIGSTEIFSPNDFLKKFRRL